MHENYPFGEIESKGKFFSDDNGIFNPDLATAENPYYGLRAALSPLQTDHLLA